MIYSTLSHDQYQEFAMYLDTLLLPIGSIQAHGPHLPVGTDSFISTRIALEVDRQLTGRLLLLPEISYGHALQSFSGTIDIPAEILRDYIYYTVTPFRQNGANYLVLINSNGGNAAALSLAADKLAEEGWTVLISNWWIDYRHDILEITPGVGHGGEDETSLMLSILPDAVSAEGLETRSISPFVRYRYKGQLETLNSNAYSGSPAQASPEKGEKLLTLIRDKLLLEIQQMWKLHS